MDGIANFIIHTIAAISFFAHNGVMPPSVPKPSVTPTVSVNQKMIHASTTIEQYGKKVQMNAAFPKDGGVVSGTVSGDCEGQVMGTYSGEKNGKNLEGVAHATCSVLFMKINADISFKGIVNEDNTNASVTYTAKVQGNTKTGTTNLSLSEE